MTAEKKLTIWFLSGWYPTRVHDTLGNFVAKHAAAVARNCEVFVLHVCTDPGLSDKEEIVQRKTEGITELICYLKKERMHLPIISGFQRYRKFRKAYRKLAMQAAAQSGNPHLIHANVFYPVSLFANMLARTYAVPFVVTEHWTAWLPEDPISLSAHQRSVSKKMAAAAACIMPVSGHLASAMKQCGLEGKYEVVSNVVDTDVFVPHSQPHKDERIQLLHISTLHEAQKNFMGLLDVLSTLKHQRTDFVLHVISDGNFQTYQKRINELELGEFLQFHGKLETRQVAAIMADADLLLLFSRYENFPCVIPEALSCGIPVLSTDVGGIAEHLSTSLGVLSPVEDIDSFAVKLNELMDRLGDFDKAMLRTYAMEHFSYEVIGKQFLGIYRKYIEDRV